MAQALLIHDRGRLVGGVKLLALAQLRLFRFAQLALRQVDPELLRHHLQGLGEFHVMKFHHKGKDVAMLAAAETVVKLPLGVDRKRRGFFIVKRTPAGKARAGPFQLDVLANHLDDVGRVPDKVFYLFTGSGNGHNQRKHLLEVHRNTRENSGATHRRSCSFFYPYHL